MRALHASARIGVPGMTSVRDGFSSIVTAPFFVPIASVPSLENASAETPPANGSSLFAPSRQTWTVSAVPIANASVALAIAVGGPSGGDEWTSLPVPLASTR